MSLNKKFKASHALFIIMASVLMFSGLPFVGWLYFSNYKKTLATHKKYFIKEIVQKGPVKEALNTVYLTELLDLSTNQPQSLITFDVNRGKQLLLGSGVIASCELTKKKPSTLEIDYEIREPIAYLQDYSNTVLDHEGVIFPLSPYYTPKVLPKIYLGVQIDPFIYGKIKHEKMKCALKVYDLIMKTIPHKTLELDLIDVSQINAESLGKQEIVVTLYETLGGDHYIRYVRLSKDNYENEFLNFLDLKAMNLPKNLTVDLRMFPNAYLTPLQHL